MPCGLFKSNGKNKSKKPDIWENFCKAPKGMTIDPPLPADYEAYIHRCGWVYYLHKPTKTRSLLHPVKLANLEARGLKGPGEYGPEMWIYEKNVNYGGIYVVDYGYPPMGEIRAAASPLLWDFKYIDRMGFDEWKKRCAAGDKPFDKECEERQEEPQVNNLVDDKEKGPEWQEKFWEVHQRVRREQGLDTSEEEEMKLVQQINDRQRHR